MRGGRGGRGRGGFRGGFGQPQAVPLTPVETYIYNPNCEERPDLSEEEKRLVVLSRVIIRSCNEGVSFIHSEPTVKLVSKYTDDFEVDVRDLDVQRQVLVDSIGAPYFPDELLSIKPPTRSGRQMIGSTKSLNWKSLEDLEKFGGLKRSAPGGDDSDAEGDSDDGEEPNDHEDYGHDHYGDEDREDDYNDDNEGGGDDY
eukprot:Blabericola_migrator_1__10430@NODE_58_length_15904_cov_68_205342_g53_i0_p6_GENE_NODE_58_length_15904_cov_68_205342_g53_i0NODE_58_length_15904_cov_68_205342_g53_i0_p6_ORF_typecomplete_len199_score38_45RNA_pol_3_Rpc31/PF11705_8/6_5e15_NODE_58_length_15904_cov_68_205342_g53_i01352314119